MWAKTWAIVGASMVGAALCGVAEAGIVDAVKVGVLDHNIRVIDPKNANKEDGPVVEAQLNFASPGFLRVIGAPRPYLVASGNTAGDTSFAGLGLEWRFGLGQDWAFEPGFGYVVHDGSVSNPFPNGDPRATDYARTRVLFGSRDLFRTSLGLTRRLSEAWDAQLFYSHLSHGQILGEGRNQGMDQAGLRIGYRFGE